MGKTTIVAEPGQQNIIMTRIFNAPRELVFETFTDPQSVPDWWGPRRLTTIVDKMEVRKGGIWRFIHRANDANEYAHNGIYHEITPPERIVNTHEFEGAWEVGLIIVTFEDEPDGKTKLTEHNIYPSVEARDDVLQSGMSEGAIELMDRLAEVLAKRQS